MFLAQIEDNKMIYLDKDNDEINSNDFEIVHIDHDLIVSKLSETYIGSIDESFIVENNIPVFDTEQSFTEAFTLASNGCYYELTEKENDE